jgi:hypothetical protein
VGGALGLRRTVDHRVLRLIGGQPNPAELTDGFSDAFLTGAGFAVLAVLIATFAISSRDSEAMKHAEVAAWDAGARFDHPNPEYR